MIDLDKAQATRIKSKHALIKVLRWQSNELQNGGEFI